MMPRRLPQRAVAFFIAAALAVAPALSCADKVAKVVSDYTVFLDPPTGFVFVKLPSGWKFVAKVGAKHAAQAPANVVTALLFGEDESEEADRTAVTETR
jgi:hypothetical protein